MSRKAIKSEDKILLSNSFLDKLDAKEIKAVELPDNMQGGQSSFILMADAKENKSYVVSLHKSIPALRNLKASAELRDLICQPEFSHPDLIEFLLFEKEALLKKLIENNEDAARWYKDRNISIISLSAREEGVLGSDLPGYLDLYYNINCSKKFEGLTLYKMISLDKGKSQSEKKLPPLIPIILQKLISATLHIYILKYMHRDISLGNVLFNKEIGALKLIDINAACDYDAKGLFNLAKGEALVDGTLVFIPPEILIRDDKLNSCFSAAVIDSFSIGSVFYHLLAGNNNCNIFDLPGDQFKNNSGVISYLKQHCQNLMKKSDAEINAHFERGLLKNKIHIDSTTKNLLMGLLHPNPQKRLKIYEIFQHPYFLNQSNKIKLEIFHGYEVALNIDNKFMVDYFKRTYPEIAFIYSLKKELCPYLAEILPSSLGASKDEKSTERNIFFAEEFMKIIDNCLNGVIPLDYELIMILNNMHVGLINSEDSKGDQFETRVKKSFGHLFELNLRMLIKNEIDPYLSQLAVQRIVEFNIFGPSMSAEARADILTAKNLMVKVKNYIKNFEKQSLEQLLSALAEYPQVGKNSTRFLRKMDAINQKFLAMHEKSAAQLEYRQSAPGPSSAG